MSYLSIFERVRHRRVGALLHAGDNVLGYEVRACSLDAANLKGRTVPDVVLVRYLLERFHLLSSLFIHRRKTYPKKNRQAKRNWRLRNLPIEVKVC